MATTTKKKTKKKSTTGPQTYYPTKVFDDNLVALVALFKSKSWSFSGIDLTQLTTDSVSQRTERASFDATESAYQNAKQTFGVSQEERYQRFAAALNAARGAFRGNKAIMKELDKFKRVQSAPAKKTTVKAPAA